MDQKSQFTRAADLTRRSVLAASAGIIGSTIVDRSGHAATSAKTMQIIDSHVHLFDVSGSEKAIWPTPDHPAYGAHGKSLPAALANLERPYGITGAIAIEASPRPEDNIWLRKQVTDSPFMVGFITSHAPGSPDFRTQLRDFSRSDLFLGVRHGNLWSRDIAAQIEDRRFLDDVAALHDSGRVLETANPDLRLVQAIVKLSRKMPDLQIIIDHMPNIRLGHGEYAAYLDALKELRDLPNVATKLAETAQTYVSPSERFNHAIYQSTTDMLYDTFGEDRVLFGSDYPNSNILGSFKSVIKFELQLLADKSETQRTKFYGANAARIYRFKARQPNQG